mgnify:CR=1 FL=1
MFGGEVLLRWKNEGKEISPSKFVPILEQTGMIAPVGKWILEETMRKGKEILKYQPDFRLSVRYHGALPDTGGKSADRADRDPF